MSYVLAILSTTLLLFSNIGVTSLEAASKSKKEKSSKNKKFVPVSQTIPKGTYTTTNVKSDWEDGALFIYATYKINGHKVRIETVINTLTASGTVYDVGDQFIFVDNILTSTLTIWEYGTYNGHPSMGHYYTDSTVYTTEYESVFIVK